MGFSFRGEWGRVKGIKNLRSMVICRRFFRVCFELIYFNSASCCSMALIFASASACFLRSFSTTWAGAPLTNFSLESFFITDTRKPWAYAKSACSLALTSSVLTSPTAGMKYSTVSQMKLHAPFIRVTHHFYILDITHFANDAFEL